MTLLAKSVLKRSRSPSGLDFLSSLSLTINIPNIFVIFSTCISCLSRNSYVWVFNLEFGNYLPVIGVPCKSFL